MGLKASSKLGSKDSKLRPKDTKLKLASLRLDTSLLHGIGSVVDLDPIPKVVTLLSTYKNFHNYNFI